MEISLLVAILLLAAALRLWGLGAKSLWVDEILAIERSRSLSQALAYCRVGHEPPLRYYALHVLAQYEPRELTCRLPAFLAGVATVGFLWLLVRLLFGARAALVAAFLLAISPWHIVHSQDARMYAVMMLLWTLSLILFFGALDRPQQPLWWPGLAIVHALNFYLSYLTVFVLLAQVLTLIGWLIVRRYREGREFSLRPFATGALIYAGFFGVLISFWIQPLGQVFERYLGWGEDQAGASLHAIEQGLRKGIEAIHETGRIDWPAEFDWRFVREILDRLLAAGPVWRIVAVLGLSVGLSLCWRRCAPFVWIAGLSFFLSIAAILFTEMKHFVATRYLFHLLLFAIVAFAVAIVAAAETILSLAPRGMGRKLAAGALALGAAVVLFFYSRHVRLHVLAEKQYWKPACAYLEEHAKPGDPIVTGPWGTHLAVLHYGRETLAKRHRIVNCLTVDRTEEEIAHPPNEAETVWYITWGGEHLPDELRLVVEDKMDRVLVVDGLNGTIEIFRRREEPPTSDESRSFLENIRAPTG